MNCLSGNEPWSSGMSVAVRIFSIAMRDSRGRKCRVTCEQTSCRSKNMHMTQRKQRLTVTVNSELVAAGKAAVEQGLADSLSAWVNEALAARTERDRRLRAMDEAIASYEAEFGEITEEEMEARRRADREAAMVVRPKRVGQASDNESSRSE